MFLSDKIIEVVEQKNNPSIVGLDPRFDLIPKYIKESNIKRFGNTLEAVGQSFYEFNRIVIDLLSEIVGIIKPQSAFYEQAGLPGLHALKKTIDYAKEKNLIVILDGKRNDIGSTATAYAGAYLQDCPYDDIAESSFRPDMLTVTPYLGSDGIEPFVNYCEKNSKGIFVLVKTSNPSSKEFQDIFFGEKTLFELVAEKVNEWGQSTIGKRGYSSVGAVVGATFPDEAKTLRKLMPRAIFLVPGYGAQGGNADSSLPCFNEDGKGALISSSRGITFPFKNNDISEHDLKKAIMEAAIAMRDDINKSLSSIK